MKTQCQDGRKLSAETMEEFRTRAVRSVQAGESPEIVIRTLGFFRACIYNWILKYRSGGWHALRSGKKTGRPGKISGAQIAWIYKIVVGRNPLQFKFALFLWLRAMVGPKNLGYL